MKMHNWSKYFPAAITVTNEDGVIIDMNDVSIESYLKDGGVDLIGKNVFDCHPGQSLAKIKKLFDEKSANIYTITKNGKRKMIYQSPYFIDGKFSGMVEMSLPLPDDVPHYDRDKK